MEFILQKKAEPFFPSLEKWIQTGQLEPAKEGIRALVSLLKERCMKQIYDKDPDLNSNFGFLLGHPIQIDVGRFRYDKFYSNQQVYREEIFRITDNLKQWLDSHSPELSLYLQNELQML